MENYKGYKRIYLKKISIFFKSKRNFKKLKSMQTYDILLEKWMDFHKNQCREFIHHEVFNNHNIKEALKENKNYHCEIKAIDEEIKLNSETKIHILSFKLSDNRKLKFIKQILDDVDTYDDEVIYYDIFYTNEKNTYEVLKIEF